MLVLPCADRLTGPSCCCCCLRGPGVVLIAGAVAGFLLCRKRRRHEPSSDKDGMQPAPRQASIVSMRNGGGPGDDDFGDVLDIEALRMYDRCA